MPARSLLLTSLALLSAALLGLFLLGRGEEPALSTPAEPGGGRAASEVLADAPVTSPPSADDAEEGPPRAAEAPSPTIVLCLAAEDRTPLAGIRAYEAERPLGPPSDEDGRLQLDRGEARAFTLWGPGRVPVSVRAFDATPETVLFTSSRGRLEVRLTGMAPDDRVLRTHLQPHAFPVSGEEPWQPRLAGGPSLLVGEQLPEGTYDVYVWVAGASGDVRPLSAAGVQVTASEPAWIELDADVPPPVEVDR